MQLWDVCSDQEAVDLVRHTSNPQEASKLLVDHALSRFSTDNLSCMIVRFDTKALQQHLDPSSTSTNDPSSAHPSSVATVPEGISEVDKITADARKSVGASAGGIAKTDKEVQRTKDEVGDEIREGGMGEAGPEVDAEALRMESERKRSVA